MQQRVDGNSFLNAVLGIFSCFPSQHLENMKPIKDTWDYISQKPMIGLKSLGKYPKKELKITKYCIICKEEIWGRSKYCLDCKFVSIRNVRVKYLKNENR